MTLEGRLKIRNFEKTAITLVVNARIPGKPLSASDDGAISVDTSKLQLLERAGTVRWEVKVEPGQTQVLTYRYERYVPSK